MTREADGVQVTSSELGEAILNDPNATGYAVVQQTGDNLQSAITSTGNSDFAFIQQVGSSNQSVVGQSGNGNSAFVEQAGSGNY